MKCLAKLKNIWQELRLVMILALAPAVSCLGTGYYEWDMERLKNEVAKRRDDAGNEEEQR